MPILKPSSEIEFKRNLSIYFSFTKNYKPIVFFILVAIAIMESLYVFERFLFKLLVDRATEFSTGALTQAAFIDAIMIIVYAFLAMTALNLILYYTRPTLVNLLEVKVIADMKRRFFRHIIHLDHNFHTTHKTGSLISRLVKGSGAMERMTDLLAYNFFPLFVQIIAIGTAMVYIDASILAIMIATTVIHISYSFYIQRLQEPSSIMANKTEDLEKGNMADFMTNVDSIKYYGKEKTINKKYHDLSEKTRLAFLKNWNYFRIMRVGQGLILGTATFSILYLTIVKFLAGEISLGTITFVYTAFTSLVIYMFHFVAGLRNFYRAMADFQELFQYSKFENEIRDEPDARNIKIERGTIEFKDVNFNYGPRSIFHNLNLKINENEKVALVGHSGSGKTTLIKLLNRFYDVDSGKILIDGKDIKDYKQESIRGETGIVPQECILFDDTLYNNIRFVDPQATREEVMRAIKFAQLDKIIHHFPEKENTVVGERGVRLSGGEKQRVSIARAILANKKS